MNTKWFGPALLLSGLTLGGCGDEPVSDGHDHGTHAPADSSSKAKAYPLSTCLVSGEELGSMGEPTSIVHEGQEIKFCCEGCEGKFRKDPAKFLKKLSGSDSPR